MTPEIRYNLFVGGAVLVALVGAFQIADGSAALTVLLCGAAAALTLNRVQPVPLGALAVGLVTAGYIIGNRGFAQLSALGQLPLFPAEIALAIGCGAVLFNSLSRREIPIARDPLNLAILLWIAIGTVRVLFDIRQHGFLAIRDYAMVYYAAFFFIAQNLARDATARRFMSNSLLVGGLLLLLVQPFYAAFPDFFLRTLTIRDIPLIYYKGDLLATFAAMLSLLCFVRFEANRKFGFLLVSLVAMGFMHTTNNRASFAGLVVATGLLAAGRRWKFAAWQVGGGIAAVALILLFAFAKGKSWESTPVYEFYERAISITDPLGRQSYKGEDTSYKGENNAFRFVWWEATARETISNNPWAGLGFGYDLAGEFVRKYYPTNEDEFTVRSPHNILVTVFGRMGLVGLLPFLAIAGLMLLEALRAVRRPRDDFETPSLWCSAWIVFTSACFGVVLEGPMGAVVFWTALGLAHHSLTSVQNAAATDLATPPPEQSRSTNTPPPRSR